MTYTRSSHRPMSCNPLEHRTQEVRETDVEFGIDVVRREFQVTCKDCGQTWSEITWQNTEKAS